MRLTRVTAGLSCEVYAKLEYFNPSGSIKDRVAKYMIMQAEKDGRVQPGDTIIENSSGNMAMSLALIAIQRGYHLKVVVRDSISKEKLSQLLALGVEVIKADTSLPPQSPDSYNNITPRLARELKHCYFPDQHNNRENNEAHYRSTGPEIWNQMDGRIDYLVANWHWRNNWWSRPLSEREEPLIQVIAVDVEGSVIHRILPFKKLIQPSPYLLEGLGDEFIVGCADFLLLTTWFRPPIVMPFAMLANWPNRRGSCRRLEWRRSLGGAESRPHPSRSSPHRYHLSGRRVSLSQHHLQ